MNYYNEIDPAAAQWLRELMDDGLIPRGDVDERSICDVQPNELAGYVQCHFFAGVGGWALALRIAGWPDDRPCWTGSCPCQPFSSAGKRKAQQDERHLWPDWRRLIIAQRPEVIWFEQVASPEVVGTKLEAAFIVAVQAGDYARANKLAHKLWRSSSLHYFERWIDGVFADLETADYSGRFEILGAHSVNSPNIRLRLFGMADLQQERTWSGIAGIEKKEEFRRDRLAIDGEPCGMGNMLSEGLQGLDRHGDGSGEPGRLETKAAGSTPPTSCVNPWSDFHIIPCRDGKYRRIPALPESILQRMADGIPVSVGDMRPESAFPLTRWREGRTTLLKGFGNAINPYVAAEFIKASIEEIQG